MKRVKIIIIALLIIVAAAFSGAWVYLRSLLPVVDGELKISAIREGVTLVRDKYGVPHISAENRHDLYFALGYVQAQDRMFQMDFYRRVARGRLAEVLGKDLLDADIYLRTIGFTRTAREQLKILPPETRVMVEAFSEGITYFIEHKRLPLEFTLLGYRPEKWTPEDSLAIGNLLGFQLASWAYQNELLNYLILTRLGPDKAALFLPVYPKDAVPIMEQSTPAPMPGKISLRSREFLEVFVSREFASNNWVIAGKRTVTGKPLLCEDSHEEGPELPTQWHLCHLTGKGIDTAGAMFPGTPVFIWGHNRSIAWGMTNFDLDNQDLYLERISPDNPNQVMFEGKWVDMQIIREKIPIKDGKKTAYREIVIRITPHGPIINDIESGIGDKPISIRRVEAEPWLISEALYKLSTARNWDDFKHALSFYPAGPQNFVYADVDGNIGYIGAGKCPIRTDSRGILPQPGWDGTHEWQGYYPFEAMPMTFNPEQGYIATANNNPVRGEYAIPLSEYWETPSRAQRITELIESKPKHAVADMIRMHLDNKSALAAQIVPVFIQILNKTTTREERKYVDELARWDYHLTPDSAAACLYEVMFNHLLMETFADELGKDLFERLIKDKIGVTNLMADLLLQKKDSILFDNVNTKRAETVNDAVTESFRSAVAYLIETLGSDMQGWQWGKLHQIEFSHIFGSEKVLRPFFNYGPFPFGGDEQTINRAGYDKTKPYKVNITASIRYIVDFSNLSNALVVLSTGQSAQLLSPHRHDMADMFLAGKYITWYMERKDFEPESEGVLRLLPLQSR